MPDSKYLQVTPQYEATTFEERVKPLVLYKQEYDKQQEVYDKLLEDTLMLENLKGSDVDADLYRQYSQWRGELNSAADTLSNTGMLDMQSARDLRRQYLNEFKPMEDRYKHRTNLIFKQASEASPDVLYKRDFSLVPVSDISLDDAVEKISLKDISKTYTDRWSGLFSAEGIPSETSAKENAIESAMAEIDLSGYSPDQVEEVRRTLSESYTKSVEAANQYNMQVEQAEATLANTRRRPTRDGNNPTLKAYKWTHPTTGVPYKVKMDSAGNYYDADGRKISYSNDIELVNKIVNSYSDYITDPTKSARYQFNNDKVFYANADGVQSAASIPGSATPVGTVSSLRELDNIGEDINTVEKILKDNGYTFEGLFTHGYSIDVSKVSSFVYVKIFKDNSSL